MNFALQKTLFGFLVMAYDSKGYGAKFLYENFGLRRLRFHATSHLKSEAKEFFLYFFQCNL